MRGENSLSPYWKVGHSYTPATRDFDGSELSSITYLAKTGTTFSLHFNTTAKSSLLAFEEGRRRESRRTGTMER